MTLIAWVAVIGCLLLWVGALAGLAGISVGAFVVLWLQTRPPQG